MSKMVDQREYWNSSAGERWIRQNEAFDHALRAFGVQAIEGASIAAGERVLDIGCGCGATSFALSDAVGPSGHVLGVDISEPMIAVARARGAGRSNLEFWVADASTASWDLPRDALVSRFGLMFFADPVTAFVHLRRALRENGRMSFVCWRALSENDWTRIPLEVAAPILGMMGDPPAPGAPGPFAFAERAYIERILSGAGFRDVRVRAFDVRLPFPSDLEQAVSFAMDIGPLVRLIADASEPARNAVRSALRSALRQHTTSDGIGLSGASWHVTARA